VYKPTVGADQAREHDALMATLLAGRRHFTAATTDSQSVEPRDSWLPRALCRYVDPETFFPINETAEQVAPAKAVCGRCPVRPHCLADALSTEACRPPSLIFGVVGGLTPSERREFHPRAIAARDGEGVS